MAEQQLSQEEFQSEQQQEPTFPGVPGLGPEPKKKQAAVPVEKPIKETAKAEPTVGLPPAPKQEGIPFFETPMQKFQREAKTEMAKEPENLSWLTETFRQYKDLDDKYSDFSFDGRMKLQNYRDAFQNKNTQIKRHDKLINSIVATSTDDEDINSLTQEDANGNKFLNKERLRRIVTNKVSARGGSNIVADFVYSKAVKAAEDKFALNKQKTVFDTKLKTANIAKPKDADVVEAEFKDIQLSARSEMKNAQESVRMDFISESNKVNDKYAYSVNQALAAAPYSMNRAVEDARNQLANEKIDPTGQYQYFEEALPQVSDDEVKQRAAEIFQQQNQDYLTTEYLPILGQMQAEVKSVSKKYNTILNRKRSEIQASYEGKFANMKAMYDKQAKDYNDNIEKLWNEAGADVDSEYNKRLQESYKNMGMGDVFTKKFTAAAGNMLFGLGTHLRANGMTGSVVDFISGIGQYGSFYNNTYTPSVKDAYLSPKFWAGGVGELLGSSSVIAATTIATRNPYIGALISNIAEGSSMAGTAYENQLMKGKDPIEARNAANSVVKMNMLTMPLNALQAKLFMPFTKGAGFIGGFKRTLAGSIGSASEEVLQSTFEAGDGFKVSKAYTPDNLEMGLSVLGSSMLMGGMSGAVSSIADGLTKNKKIPSPIAQVGARMARENGPSRIDAVAEGLNVTGEIDDEQTSVMKMASNSIIEIEQEATRIGIEGDKKDAYVGIAYDIKELEQKKEQTKSESGKAIIDRQIADKKQQLTNILDDKVELASVTIAGAKVVAPVEEVLKMMDGDDFVESVRNDEVTVESKNADVIAKLESIKQPTPVRQQNIISDTGQIIGQVTTEAAPVTTQEIAPATMAEAPITEIKTQEDATKISEGPQQEVPQPSNIVQLEGTQEGQPQIREGEGAVGQAAQPAADARNRDFGSQERQVADIERRRNEELNRYPQLYKNATTKEELQKVVKDWLDADILSQKDSTPNVRGALMTPGGFERGKELFLEERKSDIDFVAKEINAKYDAELADLERAAPMAEAAPVAEAPMQVDELLDLDLKQPGNLEKAFNWLDNADKSLGKQIGSGRFYDIAGAAATGGLITARAIVQALRAAVGGAITIRDAIAKVAKDFNITDKDVTDAINKVAEVENAERLYSKPEIRGVITIANEEAARIKTTEKSSLKAYQQVFSTVQKAIQKIYDSGLIPEGASPQVMIQVTKGIARDAVNAAYPQREVAPKVTMSVKTYIADLLRQQSIAGKKISESSKEVRKVVSDIFKSMNKRFGTTIKYTDADFRKIMKEIEDAIFRKPITKENTDELVENVNYIVEQAYIRGFEKDVRPKIAELVDRLMDAEMKRFDNVDAAAYSAFGKAVEYINNNQKEFKIKDIQPDDVLAKEIDKKLNKLKKKEKVAEADAQVMSMFSTPQVRSLIDSAQKMADDIVKANAGKKTGKTTSSQAYKIILSDLINKINAMYARGNYPSGIPSVTLVKAASGISNDSVNAAFPRSEKLSIQEAEMANMSMREYIRSIATNQIRAIGKAKDRAKAIREAIGIVIDGLSDKFGTDFKLSSSAIKQLNKALFNAVFSKMDDTTAIDNIVAESTPVVEFAIRKQILSGTAKLLDRIKILYGKGAYTGAVRLSILENLINADARKWLNSKATLEDIAMFNQYLKELTGRSINTTNLNNAIQLADTFVPTPKQSSTTEKDSLNNKIKNLIKKAAEGKLDFADYKTLVGLEKAINDINERKGALTGITAEEEKEVMDNYNELLNSLPKPIDQLLEDVKAQIDADVKDKLDLLNNSILSSQEFRDSFENPFLYKAVLLFSKEMTPDFVNSLTPKEKTQLSDNVDEILRGNPNNTTYNFSSKAAAFRQSNINYKFGTTIFSNRNSIGKNSLSGVFDKIRRIFMDVDYNRASAERMAASLDLFRFHLMDVELNTGKDEFEMGILERDVFGPLARAIDSAFNNVAESLGPLQDAMKLLNDKSNRAAIKRGIGQLNKELGTGFFGGKAKWMHIKNLMGYGNSFYMELSTRMATIVATQIDHISNLEEGESPVDVVLLRNILDVTIDEYDGRTMKEQYETSPMSITNMTDEAQLFDHIAYGILTKGGVNKLSDLSKDELLALLTENQKKALAKWREHIDNNRNVVEAAMIMRGSVTAFLNEYFPRRVFSKDGVTEIKDIEEYLNQAGNNVGIDSGQLKARKGEKGRLDLNGNGVLYNNLKDIYLIHEVKPVLDGLKGIDDAVSRLKNEKQLGAATYAEAISIAVASRVKNSLESNERIANNNYSFTFRLFSRVSSFASRVILISQLRQFYADFPSNILKLSAALGFTNRKLKNQVSQVVSPRMSSYTTDKGKFVWDDYVKIALTTGSSVHRIMSVYADNFLYEFSKSKEQLQREQRVASWQDMAVKKQAWMSRFEEAFKRITGEHLDHNAYSEERGAYRAMYYDAVQRASDAADSFVDRQFSLASIARQPVRVNIAAPFVGRAIRNIFGKSPTIAKNNPASVVLGFLSGYPSVQFQLFSRYMRSALSVDRSLSMKERTENISRALTEVVAPSVMYNVIRSTTGLLFTTVAAAVSASGDDENDRKRLYKEMEDMPFWKRWFTKMRLSFGEANDKLFNSCVNGMISSAVDPNVNALLRPAVGLAIFKSWKENAIEDMTKRGVSKKEIQEAKQKIRDIENVWFEMYSIRPIEIFGTKEYKEGVKRYYPAGTESEGIEDLIKSTGGFSVLYNEVSKTMDLTKLIDATDENKNLSETELYAAAALKLSGLTFANIILKGNAGAALSMFSGDMNKAANMIISDQKSIQTGFEIKQKKSGSAKSKKRGNRGSSLRKRNKGGSRLRD